MSTSMVGTDERRFFWKWMGVALALHLVAAVFSVGHQAADEYFQILEFLNFKLGLTPLRDLPVEYAERMRPWFQPALYFGFTKIWQFLGVTDPFTWAWSFRMFAGLAGWASGACLAWNTLPWFRSPGARRLLILLTALLWFFPVLHVRPSSEGLGGSFFALGLALGIRALNVGARGVRASWLPLLSGAFMGFAFESRFQIGVMVAAFGAWWLFLGGGNGAGEWKVRLKWLATWGAGLTLVLLLGRVIDAWGYGEWVCSPWNYVDYNLVRGEVNRYGPSPWWDVFRMSVTEAWPVLGTLLLLLCLLAWIRWPKSIVTWSTASLFVIHSAISHKELRFFFPIVNAAPVLIVLALSSRDRILSRLFMKLRDSTAGRVLIGFLAVMNLIALVALLFVPLSRNVQFYRDYDSWRRKDPAHRSELLTFGKDPYEVLGSNTYFYKPREFILTRIADWQALEARMGVEPVHLFLMTAKIPDDAPEAVRTGCAPVVQTLPAWLFELDWLNYGNWMSRVQTWSLFECTRR